MAASVTRCHCPGGRRPGRACWSRLTVPGTGRRGAGGCPESAPCGVAPKCREGARAGDTNVVIIRRRFVHPATLRRPEGHPGGTHTADRRAGVCVTLGLGPSALPASRSLPQWPLLLGPLLDPEIPQDASHPVLPHGPQRAPSPVPTIPPLQVTESQAPPAPGGEHCSRQRGPRGQSRSSEGAPRPLPHGKGSGRRRHPQPLSLGPSGTRQAAAVPALPCRGSTERELGSSPGGRLLCGGSTPNLKSRDPGPLSSLLRVQGGRCPAPKVVVSVIKRGLGDGKRRNNRW